MLVFALTAITCLYACAAGQVTVSFSEYENANCASLNNELEIAQERLQKLESIDTTERDVRKFLLGVGVFFLPPLGIINATLFFNWLVCVRFYGDNGFGKHFKQYGDCQQKIGVGVNLSTDFC